MSEADALLMEEPESSATSTQTGDLPVDWEFAERIIRRLKPRNLQDVYEMAARQSKWGGMLITLMVVVWWLLIGLDDDNMTSGVSVFFGLDFGQAALAVMVLSLVSALLTEFSRDIGKILPHRKLTRAAQHEITALLEKALAIVDPKAVRLFEIRGDVEIRIAIPINIAKHGFMTGITRTQHRFPVGGHETPLKIAHRSKAALSIIDIQLVLEVSGDDPARCALPHH